MRNEKTNENVKSDLLDLLKSVGCEITKTIQVESLPEAKQYDGVTFSLNEKKCVYRKGKVTTDRPGAFLALWKRPILSSSQDNKPIPLAEEDLDYLFIKVEEHAVVDKDNQSIKKLKVGVFVFPVSLLIKKGVLTSVKHKGKTGFRVFPPWSGDRGNVATKVFSKSGKKTQAWQLPYFVEIDQNGSVDLSTFNQIFTSIA